MTSAQGDRRADAPPAGFVVLYKPVGPSSQQLVSTVRRLAGTRRVGHAGTLDPFASGVLPLAVGKATRLVDRLHTFPKQYRARLRLGITTSTLDIEGEVIETAPVPPLTSEDIDATLSQFIGEIQQTPPAYSAVKVGGRRAYELARAGGDVALAPRSVTIYELELESLELPHITLRVSCSIGTYVRTLGADIAHALGSVGYLTELTRLRVGPFRIEEAITQEEATDIARVLGLPALIRPPDSVLLAYPAVVATGDEERRILNGAPIGVTGAHPREMVRAYDGDGELLAVMTQVQGGLAPRMLLK